MSSKIVRDKKTTMTKFFKKVDNMYWACYRAVRDIVAPVWYCFFGRKHHIIKTGLTPSCWYEVDTRLLYGNMELVKWFVENDMDVISAEEYEEEIKRVKEEDTGCGVDCLEQWTDQYEKQKQILDIYAWWLNYKNRLKDIAEALNVLSAYRCSFSSDSDSFLSNLNSDKNMNQEEKVEYNRLQKLYWDKKEELDNEENKMLHKIIDLKGIMWS